MRIEKIIKCYYRQIYQVFKKERWKLGKVNHADTGITEERTMAQRRFIIENIHWIRISKNSNSSYNKASKRRPNQIEGLILPHENRLQTNVWNLEIRWTSQVRTLLSQRWDWYVSTVRSCRQLTKSGTIVLQN